jgi:phosphatidyl-myo-inositol alpha-mannosyltransferase
MRILLTHPFCWPYVRRGGERIFHELGVFLADRGHHVTLLTSIPDASETEKKGNITIFREQQFSNRLLARVGVLQETMFAWTCFRFLQRHQFDVVGCLHYSDGFAAGLARRLGNPYVVHIMGLPYGKWIRRAPWETLIMSRSVRRAERVLVLSSEAERRLEHYFGRQGEIIGAPCDLALFPMQEGRDLQRPRILGVGAFSQPRKGAAVLIRAFELLKRDFPSAILQYSGHLPSALKAQLLSTVPGDLGKDVEFLDVGNLADLPNLYGQAAVTVLPSVEEAFGMTLVESLACGTPIVGSRAGGIPDIVQDGVGFTFDPGDSHHNPSNPEGLASAIKEAIQLHNDPCVHARCRRSAERFGWQQIGPRIEDIYQAAARWN